MYKKRVLNKKAYEICHKTPCWKCPFVNCVLNQDRKTYTMKVRGIKNGKKF